MEKWTKLRNDQEMESTTLGFRRLVSCAFH